MGENQHVGLSVEPYGPSGEPLMDTSHIPGGRCFGRLEMMMPNCFNWWSASKMEQRAFSSVTCSHPKSRKKRGDWKNLSLAVHIERRNRLLGSASLDGGKRRMTYQHTPRSHINYKKLWVSESPKTTAVRKWWDGFEDVALGSCWRLGWSTERWTFELGFSGSR